MDEYDQQPEGNGRADDFSRGGSGGGSVGNSVERCSVDDFCSGHAIKCMQKGARQKCVCTEGWEGKDCSRSLSGEDSGFDGGGGGYDVEADFGGPEGNDYGQSSEDLNGNGVKSRATDAGEDYGDAVADTASASAHSASIDMGGGLGLGAQHVALLGGLIAILVVFGLAMFCRKKKAAKSPM
jgi:hypothetical protein